MKFLFNRNDVDIFFVYGERYKHSGSTIMRGLQLSDIIRTEHPELKIKYSSSENTYKNSLLFLTKGSLQSLNKEALKMLKAKKNTLVFDPVDSLVPSEKAVFADCIVAASYAAKKSYTEEFPGKQIILVDHHVDPRLKNVSKKIKFNKPSIGYFGETINTIKTEKIQKYVDFIHIDTSKQDEAWFNKLPFYNVHYTIRDSNELEVYKPFTKGFIAAHMGANIIAHEKQTDAETWLGSDYPFLMKGTVDEDSIVKMLKKVYELYGTDEWDKALKVIDKIKQKTSDKVIAKQLISGLRDASLL